MQEQLPDYSPSSREGRQRKTVLEVLKIKGFDAGNNRRNC